MLNLRRTALAAAILAALGSTFAIAAGTWSMMPIVGGASFCGATVTGTGATGTICAQTVPAGPPSLTGLELIPADTQGAGGAAPQTVTVTACQAGYGAYTVNAPAATGFTVVIPNNTCSYIIDTTACAAGVCATGTVTMPAAPLDGQQLYLTATATGAGGTVTALTLSPAAGQTIANIPTAITASLTAPYGYRFIYRASVTRWVRLQ